MRISKPGELKLAPFGRPLSPFLQLLGRRTISLRLALSFSLRVEASLSVLPGCSLGSLSSPVRASNPSWTKVLPAPSHVGRTFPCPGISTIIVVAIVLAIDRPVSQIAGNDHTDRSTRVDLRAECVVNGDVRERRKCSIEGASKRGTIGRFLGVE